jgi:proline iminopeptidase
MDPDLQSNQPAPREGYLPVAGAELYYREIGQGPPIILLHGGPDFDHNYLLPDMDRLSDSFRLIYYDQRGRGKSGGAVRPDDVTLQSDIEDLERLRQYFGLESVALLGHSWGGLLAMEYAIRHPDRVSRLILMNTGPASYDDYMLFRQDRRSRVPDDIAELQTLAASAGYAQGDLETDVAYYRIHYRATLKSPEQLKRLARSLRANVTPAGILKARAIEERLMNETWWASGYNLLPALSLLRMPTLIIHGDYDFVPLACAFHIAAAIPRAYVVMLGNCGHFAFIERPDVVREEIEDFFARE